MINVADKKGLINAINLPNIQFMEVLVHVLENYEACFSNEDIWMLEDRETSRIKWKQDYPVLLKVDISKDKMSQIHLSGNYRYYANKKCTIKGVEYYYTSQLYGYGESATRPDNRIPLWRWVCEKVGITETEIDNHSAELWWPSPEEYSLDITKADWEKYILDIELPKHPAPMKMLKAMMELGGECTCKELSDVYGGHPSSYSGCAVNIGRRVKEYFDLLPCMEGDKEHFFAFPFLGKYRGGAKDNYIYKIRPELFDALKGLDLSGIDPYVREEVEQLSIKETLTNINSYIAFNGFTFDKGLVENYYLSLKSKPFVILAGTSGTGKTKLVKLFAEAIGAKERYLLVPVRPDWSDSTDLFGHVNLNDEFVNGAIIDFLKEAKEHPGFPYFLCLDEMNLARVEYYLSDILSIIETREREEEKIITKPLISLDYYGTNKTARDNYGEIRIPENLYIIGTVNMDETTFPFSKKVLDRANTIEFSTVDFLSSPEVTTVDAPKSLELNNEFMKAPYIFFKECEESDKSFAHKLCVELQAINKILEKANAHVGYRVRDEITFYMFNNKNADLLSEEEAFDNEIMQKILPRIQGSSAAVKRMLCELFKYCAGSSETYNAEDGDVSKKMFDTVNSKDCKYKKSAEKIAFMVRRLEEDGFTAYWL